MTLPIRYSPSGAPIENANGGPLVPGAGMRMRLVEANSTMGGSLAIPSAAPAVVSPAGFTDPNAIVLTLPLPKEGNEYRAQMSLDLVNVGTVAAQVVLFLDTSVDGGTTYTNRAKFAHVTPGGSRNCNVILPLTLGSDLGVNDALPTANLKMRARAQLTVGTLGDVAASALATSGSVTQCTGTVHLELEECF